MSQTKQNQPQPGQPRADQREFDKTQPSRTDSRQAEAGPNRQNGTNPRPGQGAQPGGREQERPTGPAGQPDAQRDRSAPRQHGTDDRRGGQDVDRRGLGDDEDTDQPRGIDEAVAEGVNDTTKQQADGRPQTPEKANKAY